MDKLTILTINRTDTRGGAAAVAWNLFSDYLKLGFSSWFLVQHKFSTHQQVLTIDNERYLNGFQQFISWLKKTLLKRAGESRGVWRFTKLLDWVAHPGVMIRQQLGIEEFNFKGSRKILSRVPVKPDIIHAHVLHGDFFDLRYLAEVSNEIPVIFTLHDAWMLAGHCAHSFECERWKTGCGKCPDISIPKAIRRDSSAYNWKRKQRIYKKSKFYVAAPCEWLIKKVKASMLSTACVEIRVIPHGVNQEIFYPSNRKEARMRLNLAEESFIFLFSANGIRRNRWKDFEMMKRALELVAATEQKRKIIFLALGDTTDPIIMGNAEIRFMPYCSDPHSVADFYRAADVYLHASKADTFPNAVLEALSCGTPVIGTIVGGIPEQIKGWQGVGFLTSTYNIFNEKRATGVLVEPGDAVSFSKAMVMLMELDSVRVQLGQNASADAFERFPIQKQTNAYLAWYREILTRKNNYE